MGNKTSIIVIANVITFLLYLKFGIMSIWVPAVIGFTLVMMFIFINLILMLFSTDFYESKFLPGIKRITGSDIFETKISNEQRVIIRKGIPPLIFVITVLTVISILVIRYF